LTLDLLINNLLIKLKEVGVLTNEAIKFYGSKTKLAEVAGVSQSAVSHWVRTGFIPAGSAAVLSESSDGKLIFNKNFYQLLKKERASKRINKRKNAA